MLERNKCVYNSMSIKAYCSCQSTSNASSPFYRTLPRKDVTKKGWTDLRRGARVTYPSQKTSSCTPLSPSPPAGTSALPPSPPARGSPGAGPAPRAPSPSPPRSAATARARLPSSARSSAKSEEGEKEERRTEDRIGRPSADSVQSRLSSNNRTISYAH